MHIVDRRRVFALKSWLNGGPPPTRFQEIGNYGVGHTVPEENLCKKRGTSQQFWVMKKRIAHGSLKFQTSFGLLIPFGENLRSGF